MARKRKPDFTGKTLTDEPPYIFQPDKRKEHRKSYFFCSCSGEGVVKSLEAEWRERMKREESESIELRLKLQISKKHQIGPICAIYYRELVLGHYYQSSLQFSRFANTSFFCSEGRRRDPEEWLAYDRYLDSVLSSLGLRWWDIERVICHEFQRPLPKNFKPSSGDIDAVVSNWQIAWTDRLAEIGSRKGKRSHAKKVEEIAEQVHSAGRLEAIANAEITSFPVSFDAFILPDGTPRIAGVTEEEQAILEAFHDHYPIMPLAHEDQNSLHGSCLYELCIRKIEAESFLLTEPDQEDKLFNKYSTRQRSPFINRIVFSVGTFLWENMGHKRRPASAPAKYVQERNRVWREMGADLGQMSYYVPEEFYMLLADLLYHLPVVIGLPDKHEIVGALYPKSETLIPPPNWQGLTADNIRQRFGSEYNKFRRRS